VIDVTGFPTASTSRLESHSESVAPASVRCMEFIQQLSFPGVHSQLSDVPDNIHGKGEDCLFVRRYDPRLDSQTLANPISMRIFKSMDEPDLRFSCAITVMRTRPLTTQCCVEIPNRGEMKFRSMVKLRRIPNSFKGIRHITHITLIAPWSWHGWLICRSWAPKGAR
jgi:hypothetical protein